MVGARTAGDFPRFQPLTRSKNTNRAPHPGWARQRRLGMAKTRKTSSRSESSGEKSNTGLIVTLVFFVIATIALGVTTYMGYGGKAEADKQAKTADDKATAEKKKADEAEARRLALKVAIGTADGGERAR